MKIERIELHHITQPLVHPFRTSFGEKKERPCILVAVYSEGLVGWGECVASAWPGYSYETIGTAWHILSDFLVPKLLGQDIHSGLEMPQLFRFVRGHPLAKAGLENAVWDLLAKAEGMSLQRILGGQRDRVEVGVSIGIQPSLPALVERVASFIEQGYQRIKMKIEPGWELEPIRAIRARYPDIKLMVDANSAFSLSDVPLFQAMDEFNLLMIEQPLNHDDIYEHSKLQAQINTAICLDESIHSPYHAAAAIELKAGRIINMKVGRVGGLSHAITIHDMCLNANLDMWCGGMLETGVGRATNLHLASMQNFTLPADISATDRYYAEDIAEPSFTLNAEDSTITVPDGVGIGVEVIMARVEKYRRNHWVMQNGE